MATNNERLEFIKSEIERWNNKLATQSMLPERAKQQIQGIIDGLKAEQKQLQSAGEPKKETPKEEPKKEAPVERVRKPRTPKAKKVKAPKKAVSKPKVSEEGVPTKVPMKRGRKPKVSVEKKPKKEYTPRLMPNADEPDCDTLLSQFRERRQKAKQSSKKRKTKPVFRKIASDVTDAVEKAIKNVPKKKLKESPKDVIKKFGALQNAAQAFLRAFKNILGEDYKETQSNIELNELEKMINSLIKKYNK